MSSPTGRLNPSTPPNVQQTPLPDALRDDPEYQRRRNGYARLLWDIFRPGQPFPTLS